MPIFGQQIGRAHAQIGKVGPTVNEKYQIQYFKEGQSPVAARETFKKFDCYICSAWVQ